MLMRSRNIPKWLAALGIVAMAAVATGCSREGNQEIPRTESGVKQSWDSPLSDETADALRNRLATTQRDN